MSILKEKYISWFAVLIILLVCPLPIAAEDMEPAEQEEFEGSATIGAAGVGVNNESFKFGEYTGISDSDGYFVGDMDLWYRRGELYMELLGEDIGLDNRKVSLETGRFGKFKFTAEYDELPHLLNNATQTPFQGTGGTNLTLLPTFGKNNSASLITQTGQHQEDLEFDRRRSAKFGFSGKLGASDFTLVYHRETKDGVVDFGSVVNTSPGGQSIIIPGAVEQVSNEVRATLAQNGEEGQIQLDFYVSLFDNQVDSISWEDPFSRTDTGTGLMSRPPDNRHLKLSLSGGRNLPYNSRVSGVMEYGLMEQDEELLPFALGTSTSLLPRTNAQAEIQTLHVNFNATSRPLPKLGLRAKYRHYQTFNETEQSLFRYMRNDSDGGTQAAISADEAMFNLPYDYIQDRVELGLSYAVYKATTLKLDYNLDIYERDFREVTKTEENSFKAGIRSRYWSFAEAGYSAHVSFKEEQGNYDAARVFQTTHTQQHIATGTTFDNLLDSRRFDIASRDRIKHSGHINLFPSETTTVGMYYNYTDDDYDDTQIGLNFNKSQEATLDLGYSPTPLASFHAFYTFEKIESERTGREWTTGTAESEFDLTRNWTSNNDTHVHTVGFGGNFVLMQDKLDLKMDYSFSESTEAIDFTTGTNAAVAGSVSNPDVVTTQHKLDITANHKWSKNLDVGLRYVFDKYQSSDFSTDNLSPGSAVNANLLILEGTVPDFTAHTGMVFATYYFGEGRP